MLLLVIYVFFSPALFQLNHVLAFGAFTFTAWIQHRLSDANIVDCSDKYTEVPWFMMMHLIHLNQWCVSKKTILCAFNGLVFLSLLEFSPILVVITIYTFIKRNFQSMDFFFFPNWKLRSSGTRETTDEIRNQDKIMIFSAFGTRFSLMWSIVDLP